MKRRDFLALALFTVVSPCKRKPSIVEQIIAIFLRRGYEIDERTAAECWRQHGYDRMLTETDPFLPLPKPDEVFRIVVEKEKQVRRGMKTHLVRLP